MILTFNKFKNDLPEDAKNLPDEVIHNEWLKVIGGITSNNNLQRMKRLCKAKVNLTINNKSRPYENSRLIISAIRDAYTNLAIKIDPLKAPKINCYSTGSDLTSVIQMSPDFYIARMDEAQDEFTRLVGNIYGIPVYNVYTPSAVISDDTFGEIILYAPDYDTGILIAVKWD